jgi:hypothetical protein
MKPHHKQNTDEPNFGGAKKLHANKIEGKHIMGKS